MIMVTGGAFQGKLEYVKKRYRLKEEEIFECSNTKIDFSKPCIDHLEEFTLACVEKQISPLAYFKANEEKWAESVIILQDIFCGVVPVDEKMRLWRDETGRLAAYLSGKAEGVTRVFLGIPQNIK